MSNYLIRGISEFIIVTPLALIIFSVYFLYMKFILKRKIEWNSVETLCKFSWLLMLLPQNSAHRYGTTIDIGYYRFERTDNLYPYEIPKEQLRNILAEVIRDMKAKGKMYIKYDVKQGCFHITVRW